MLKSCIRVYANQAQIDDCKQSIEDVSASVTRISKALNLAGNEVRLKILFLLAKESQMCPCDLSDVLGMTVPAISQHLKKLKEAGIVKSEKIGQTVIYSLAESNSHILNPIFNLLASEKQLAI